MKCQMLDVDKMMKYTQPVSDFVRDKISVFWTATFTQLFGGCFNGKGFFSTFAVSQYIHLRMQRMPRGQHFRVRTMSIWNSLRRIATYKNINFVLTIIQKICSDVVALNHNTCAANHAMSARTKAQFSCCRQRYKSKMIEDIQSSRRVMQGMLFHCLSWQSVQTELTPLTFLNVFDKNNYKLAPCQNLDRFKTCKDFGCR